MPVSYRAVLRCLLEGVQWLLGPAAAIRVTGKSGISQARTRLGAAPLQQLYDEVVGPIAVTQTKGAWYRRWRVVTLDGSTMDVADTVDQFLEAVSRALAAGKHIEIRGFGTFKVKDRKSRLARNPRTGESVPVPPRRVPVFKVSKELKDIVAQV